MIIYKVVARRNDGREETNFFQMEDIARRFMTFQQRMGLRSVEIKEIKVELVEERNLEINI